MDLPANFLFNSIFSTPHSSFKEKKDLSSTPPRSKSDAGSTCPCLAVSLRGAELRPPLPGSRRDAVVPPAAL